MQDSERVCFGTLNPQLAFLDLPPPPTLAGQPLTPLRVLVRFADPLMSRTPAADPRARCACNVTLDLIAPTGEVSEGGLFLLDKRGSARDQLGAVTAAAMPVGADCIANFGVLRVAVAVASSSLSQRGVHRTAESRHTELP